jgi:hypothetical protein
MASRWSLLRSLGDAFRRKRTSLASVRSGTAEALGANRATEPKSSQDRRTADGDTCMPTTRLTMVRAMAWLGSCGIVALLVAWPLWLITRTDTSGCRSGVPCDPALNLPFGSLAFGLTIAGLLVLLIVAMWLVAIGVSRVIRHDARVRAARWATGE